ncbi:MAG TPA: LysM peptidoglycan-binding domain-containing protein [Candidatus Saccharibacteria bacterium]|nr:LysM peptidoglycan-binding domain-containing protein [Candidatus Saccharibacteria bacterium]HRK94533.1 LysM peptidoglycan-binding domain-containing protein [Candidatus Saccharibacteria bacterium]
MLKKHIVTPKKHSGVSASKIVAYVGAFLLLIAIVAIGYESPRQASSQVANTDQTASAPSVVYSDDTAPSVDQVLATSVAAGLAERANLPIASNVANMSVSLSAKSELAQTDTSAITKPQIVKPTSSNRSIITYVVKKGETVPELAARFNITADTIRWANNLGDTDALEVGRKLTILPTSGVLYTVKSGETVEDIASRYSSSTDRITLFNDLELSGLKAGRRIIIPEGEKPAPAPPAVTSSNSFTSNLGGSVVSNGFIGISAGNKYAPGNCTWYAYERRQQLGRPVGSFWGNANTWASAARSSGYAVNNVPKAGAVLVDQAGYFGHVAVVERVKPNGDISVTEMNNYAYGGFNIVNERTISAGQARNYLYIH